MKWEIKVCKYFVCVSPSLSHPLFLAHRINYWEMHFYFFVGLCCAELSTQSCLTLGDTMDCSHPGSSVQGALQAKNTGLGSLSLLQGVFSTQKSNRGFLHCRWILYLLSYLGSSSLGPGTHHLKCLARFILHIEMAFLLAFSKWLWHF